MSSQPNILILMCDQMQAAVLDPDHPCQTPMLDRYLLERGTRFVNGITSNAICSPARASLMTGLLPHNHGVLTVTHTVDDDQSCLRTRYPHFAQHLVAAGYRTGYFGKWHIERSRALDRFGWQDWVCDGDPRMGAGGGPADEQPAYQLQQPPGYPPTLLYGLTAVPVAERHMGAITGCAAEWLDERLAEDGPWCCMVSVPEPHDPYRCGRAAFERYDALTLPAPASRHDPMSDKPAVYRRSARVFADLDEAAQREARACYYGSISEIDEQFGRLLTQIEDAGQLDQTLILLCADHGDLLGAHGMWCKNFGAFEEVYRIPLVIAGPGVAAGATCTARMALHDLAPTLCAAVGAEPMEAVDGRNLQHLLAEPAVLQPGDDEGYAEYHGGRFILTQRVLWQGSWKYVFNGFDEDELYDLATDPHECRNLIFAPAARDQAERMMCRIWQRLAASGDHGLHRSPYPPLRLGLVGPLATAPG